MTVGERNTLADRLLDLLKSAPDAGDQVAVTAMLAGKVIALGVKPADRLSASKAFQATMNAQLTLESVGEHRAIQPIGRFSAEDE